MFENNPHLVPMTAKLVSMGRNAYSHYIMHLEEEKKLKEEQEKKKKEELRVAQEAEEENKQAKDSREKIIEMEKKILKSKSDQKNNSKAFEEIFDNATERLKKALEKGDLEEASVAQSMLEGAKAVKKKGEEKSKEVDVLQRRIEKRKNSVIDMYFKKIPKK